WVKHAAGLAMVLAFFLYIRKELPASVWFTLVGTGVLLLTLFVRSVFPLAVQKSRFHNLLRAGGIIAAGLLFWSAWSPTGGPGQPDKDRVVWITNFDSGLRKASELGRPIIVDLWAEWCSACHELDDRTYSDPGVQKEIQEKFVAIKIDATNADAPGVSALTNRYGVVGLPTVLFLSSKGDAYENLTLTGFLAVDDFLELLKKVPGAPKN
ncbi:MAG: thioredoxin family protein, partial [Pseudomonadota bacterium]